jgi:hypothetical protein
MSRIAASNVLTGISSIGMMSAFITRGVAGITPFLSKNGMHQVAISR